MGEKVEVPRIIRVKHALLLGHTATATMLRGCFKTQRYLGGGRALLCCCQPLLLLASRRRDQSGMRAGVGLQQRVK